MDNKRFTSKGRSRRTVKNKERKLKRLYQSLFKASLKKKKQNPQKTYFCDKFKTVDSFLKIINIKQSNIEKKWET